MRFAFISNNTSAPWGGSEELWSQASATLARDGHSVLAAVPPWSPPPRAWATLAAAGVTLAPMRHRKSDTLGDLLRRGLRQPLGTSAQRQLRRHIMPFRPDLVVISQMLNWDGLPWMQACAEHGLPFVVIAQAASESYWPSGDCVGQLRSLLPSAQRACFVSEHNRRLTETQLALRLPNAAIVRNPFLVDFDLAPQWPDAASPATWRLACVARYAPGVKGHDLLFEVLGRAKWRERPLTVSCFGGGDAAGLQRLADLFHASSVKIEGSREDMHALWREHHTLVLASRFEGLPLAVVEAMLAHRPCIVTPAGGSREVVQDGVTGFVAASIDADAFDAALERAWSRRDEWRAIGRRAGEAIRGMFPRDPAREFAAVLTQLASP